MRPSQIVHARKRVDAAFLPLGAIEWHGVHNPVGIDALKAHAVCCAAARILTLQREFKLQKHQPQGLGGPRSTRGSCTPSGGNFCGRVSPLPTWRGERRAHSSIRASLSDTDSCGYQTPRLQTYPARSIPAGGRSETGRLSRSKRTPRGRPHRGGSVSDSPDRAPNGDRAATNGSSEPRRCPKSGGFPRQMPVESSHAWVPPSRQRDFRAESAAVCHTADLSQNPFPAAGSYTAASWRSACLRSIADSVADHASTRLSSNRLRDTGTSGGHRESERFLQKSALPGAVSDTP